MKSKNSPFRIKSRLLLVIIVIISAFLAAFLGQVLITSLSTGPSLDINQPSFIVSNRTDEGEIARESLAMINRTEQPSIVKIYSSDPELVYETEGVVLTNDGWIMTVNQEGEDPSDWGYIRFNSGELLEIESFVIHDFYNTVYLQVESDNLSAAKLVREDLLSEFDPVLVMSADHIVGKSEYLGQIKNQDSLLSSDQQNSFRYIQGNYSSGMIYSLDSELLGVVYTSPENSSITYYIDTFAIRNGLDELLREGEVLQGQLGITYTDLAQTPVIDQPASGALVITVDQPRLSSLQVNDLIVSVNGELLNHRLTLSDLIEGKQAEDSLEIGILRRGTPQTLTITLN